MIQVQLNTPILVKVKQIFKMAYMLAKDSVKEINEVKNNEMTEDIAMGEEFVEVETDLIFLDTFSPTSQDLNQEIPIIAQNQDLTVEHQNTSNDAVKNISNVTTNVRNEESEIVQQHIV